MSRDDMTSYDMEMVKDYNDQQTALNFMNLCPDFPQTEQANQALLGIVDAHGWQYTPENLQAAHLMAMSSKSQESSA